MSAARARVVVRELDHGWQKLHEAVRVARGAKPYVKVGVLDDGGPGSGDHDGITTAELAAVLEFGTEDGHIPARPFVGSTFDANRTKYQAELMKLLGRVYSGQFTITRVLSLMGLRMVADINRAARAGDGIPPPNASSTIATKGSSHTLIDTGRMLAALTYAVVFSGSEVEKGGPGDAQ